LLVLVLDLAPSVSSFGQMPSIPQKHNGFLPCGGFRYAPSPAGKELLTPSLELNLQTICCTTDSGLSFGFYLNILFIDVHSSLVARNAVLTWMGRIF
jgi:hypothetical protein